MTNETANALTVGLLIFLATMVTVGLVALTIAFQEIKKFMTTSAQALTDLQNVAASIQAGVTSLQAVDGQIDAAVKYVEELLTQQGVAPASIEAVVAQLKGIQISIGSVTSDLTAQSTTLEPPASTITVSISPTTATVAQGSTQQFSATVTNDPANAGVTWSLAPVVAPALTGSISSTGLYTPPTTPGGTDTVIATSISNTTVSATATVTF